jgi:hypothetical protein
MNSPDRQILQNESAQLLRRAKAAQCHRMARPYLVAAWLLLQVAGTMLPAFDVPARALRGLIITSALGFVPALAFSGVSELTPQGLKRDEAMAPPGGALSRRICVIQKTGAYRVRYLFVICGFPTAETENPRKPFLLDRALQAEGSEPF